jgi:hypothetical protein
MSVENAAFYFTHSLLLSYSTVQSGKGIFVGKTMYSMWDGLAVRSNFLAQRGNLADAWLLKSDPAV